MNTVIVKLDGVKNSGKDFVEFTVQDIWQSILDGFIRRQTGVTNEDAMVMFWELVASSVNATPYQVSDRRGSSKQKSDFVGKYAGVRVTFRGKRWEWFNLMYILRKMQHSLGRSLPLGNDAADVASRYALNEYLTVSIHTVRRIRKFRYMTGRRHSCPTLQYIDPEMLGGEGWLLDII